MIDKVKSQGYDWGEWKELYNIRVTANYPSWNALSSSGFPADGGGSYNKYTTDERGDRKGDELWDFLHKFNDRSYTIYYLKARFAERGFWNRFGFIDVLEYFIYDPKSPHYSATKTYFPNQLVSTFSNLHETVALLKEDGTIGWKTTPNLMLMRNGNEEGKIIHLRTTTPNGWEIGIVKDAWNILDHYRIHSISQFERPREKPYTETDKEVILTAPGWKGTHFLSYHVRRKLNNMKQTLGMQSNLEEMKAKVKGLHAMFSSQTIVEEITETIPEGNKDVVKVKGRRYLAKIYSVRPKENKMVEVILPKIGENKTDIFTIKRVS